MARKRLASFDTIGNKEKAVAIVEKADKALAALLMKKHKNVKTVLAKKSPRFGVYRTREYEIVAGEDNTEVVHAESGCRLMLDPQKAYFSPRESTERMRVAAMVKPGENVMVFFAGVGPFAIIISKKTKARSVVGIEINPAAVAYFEKNIALNKAKNVKAVLGDVKERAADFYGKCDRVIMPLPESSLQFMDEAVNCLKKGGTCHMYCFAEENKLGEIVEKMSMQAEKSGRKIKFIGSKKVLPWGPKIWKMRLDFIVS